MTVYWVGGGEDIDLTKIGSAVTNTTSFFRSGYGRSAYACLNPQGANAGYSWRGSNLFSLATFWLGARFWNTATLTNPTTGNAPVDLIRFYDASGTARLAIVNTGSSNYTSSTMVLQSINISGTRVQLGSSWTTGSTFTINQSTPDKLDINLNYATSGFFNVYINGLSVFSFSGDITTNGITALAGFELFGGNSVGNIGYWSELLIADFDTRLSSVYTYVQWSGPISGISELVANDLTGLSSTAASQVEDITLTGTTIPNVNLSVVKAVAVTTRTIAGNSPPQHLDVGLTISGGEYFSNTIAIANSFSNQITIFNTNPANSAAWSYSAIPTVGATVRSRT
jgi:hypothetical protein